MAEDRGWLGDSLAFTKSVGSGAWNASSGMVEGLWDLAEGGYKLATDAEAREAAWDATKQLSETAKEYGEAVYEDPEKAYREARDGALVAYDKFEQAKDLADAEGRSAEFWGEMAGGGAFEVVTVIIPAGVLAKAGRLGQVVKISDDVSGVAKTVKKAENIKDVFSPAKKAKGVEVKPVIMEADAKCSAVQKCSIGDGVKNTNKKADQLKKNKAQGKQRELAVKKQLEAEGHEVLGSEVAIKTPKTNRRVDHLIRDRKTGKLKAIEVKSGNAKRNKTQVSKDDAMESNGGKIIGKNAPADLKGSTVKIPTEVRN